MELMLSDVRRVRAFDEYQLVMEEYRTVKNKDGERQDWCFDGYFPTLDWLQQNMASLNKAKAATMAQRGRAQDVLLGLHGIDLPEMQKRLDASVVKRVVAPETLAKIKAAREAKNGELAGEEPEGKTGM